jgi:hypothetical protein
VDLRNRKVAFLDLALEWKWRNLFWQSNRPRDSLVRKFFTKERHFDELA